MLLTDSNTTYLTNSENLNIAIQQNDEFSATQILLKIDFRLWGDSVKADTSDMEIDANKSLLSLQKKLITCKEYEQIKSLTKKIGKRVLRICLPASKSFRSGFYRVPLQSVEETNNLLLDAYRDFLSTVRGFLFAYQDAKIRASLSKESGGLGVLYRESDYPTDAELETKFSFSWQFISFAVPQGLPTDVEQRERETFRKNLQAAKEECVEALRVGFSSLVDRATERLKETPDGKRQRFQESLTTQMTEFIDSFSARNSIGNDAQLSALVEKAKQIMSICPNLTDLKDDSAMRQQIQGKFAEIQTSINAANLIPRKGRAMQVSDDMS